MGDHTKPPDAWDALRVLFYYVSVGFPKAMFAKWEAIVETDEKAAQIWKQVKP